MVIKPQYVLLTLLYVSAYLIGQQCVKPTVNSAAGHGAGHYETYSNDRFSYSVCYPPELLKAQGESPNGDGQEFLSKTNDALMIVYGSNNVLGQTLQDALQEEVEDFNAKSPKAKITYKAIKGGWFALSGVQGGKIVYQKTVLRKGVFKTFRLEYNESERAVYDPVVKVIFGCFRG
jgi:hypothetical protein